MGAGYGKYSGRGGSLGPSMPAGGFFFWSGAGKKETRPFLPGKGARRLAWTLHAGGEFLFLERDRIDVNMPLLAGIAGAATGALQNRICRGDFRVEMLAGNVHTHLNHLCRHQDQTLARAAALLKI